ncbi:MAG: DUF456 domain-containing protein [Flavobacteriaceae bacterium]
MDTFFELIGFFFALLGIAGSFLPVLPGPLTGWCGLFLLHQSSRIEDNPSLLTITFIIALSVFLLDYIIPALGTKKFGGSKKGVIGSTIGLILGLLFLGPLGIILGPFAGAYVGERMNQTPNKLAFKAAFGSLIGFLTGVFLKFTVAFIFCVYFIKIYWTHLL